MAVSLRTARRGNSRSKPVDSGRHDRKYSVLFGLGARRFVTRFLGPVNENTGSGNGGERVWIVVRHDRDFSVFFGMYLRGVAVWKAVHDTFPWNCK